MIIFKKNVSIFLLSALVLSCTNDNVPEPEICVEVITYDETVRQIVRNNCTDSGCHDGASGVGNYNSFNGIKNTFENSEFRRQVILEKLMPKDFSLNPEDFEKLKCWAENNFPEN